jgi:hypothetical protein
MYRAAIKMDPHHAIMESLRSRLKSLDLRIARMKEIHAGSADPLAQRLIQHSSMEREEVAAKLALT